jgi:2-polyprenyl-3-methyl-5-hydroxy-6-metoxy-1,4-benzoquinol methylase
MIDSFYRAFEERLYAPRKVIKMLRKQYLPFVLPLAAVYSGVSTFDIGCGRGEWLELMAGIGFKPHGVDLDEGMLNDCLELNLSAEKGDAVAFLATLPSESQAVVSAFHVVEHIRFEQLRTVVSEALRVLKPGGRLMVSDIVLNGELPQWVKESVTAYSACVSGAEKKNEYLDKMKKAGIPVEKE